MLEHLALEGVWLVGGLAVAVVVGMFAAQYVKDKVTGVPSALRTALQDTETQALAALKDAQSKIVADVASVVAKPPVVPAVAGASGAQAPAVKPAVTGL